MDGSYNQGRLDTLGPALRRTYAAIGDAQRGLGIVLEAAYIGVEHLVPCRTLLLRVLQHHQDLWRRL